MALFKNLINKIHNQASSNNPVMFDSISKFDAPNMEERAMYKKGGYMMGGSPMTDQMQGQMKKKMTEPRGGYAHGGKAMGGKADIAAMEKACSAMAGKNKSVTY